MHSLFNKFTISFTKYILNAYYLFNTLFVFIFHLTLSQFNRKVKTKNRSGDRLELFDQKNKLGQCPI